MNLKEQNKMNTDTTYNKNVEQWLCKFSNWILENGYEPSVKLTNKSDKSKVKYIYYLKSSDPNSILFSSDELVEIFVSQQKL